MEEFFLKYFGGLDTVAIAALAVISATAATSVVAIASNMEHWGRWRNPLYQQSTDTVMPIVAVLHGTLYGLLVGPLPGWFDNIHSSVLYGAATMVMYYAVRKVVTAWGPTK